MAAQSTSSPSAPTTPTRPSPKATTELQGDKSGGSEAAALTLNTASMLQEVKEDPEQLTAGWLVQGSETVAAESAVHSWVVQAVVGALHAVPPLLGPLSLLAARLGTARRCKVPALSLHVCVSDIFHSHMSVRIGHHHGQRIRPDWNAKKVLGSSEILRTATPMFRHWHPTTMKTRNSRSNAGTRNLSPP